jgi:hypothetical protein
VYYVSDHAPNLELGLGGHLLRVVITVFWNEGDFFVSDSYSFHGQLAVNDGYYDVFVFGFFGAVDYEQVVVVYACSYHRITGGPDKKGRGGIFDEVSVEVELVLAVIGGGGWEAGGHLCCEDGLFAFTRNTRFVNCFGFHHGLIIAFIGPAGNRAEYDGG